MKNYLEQFRDQVFNGSLILYKRVFFRFLILNLLVGLLSLLIYTPLILKSFNWSLTDLLELQARMQEMGEMVQKGGNPSELLSNIFGTPNYFYLALFMVVAAFISSWSMNLYYQLNDLEIRNGNSSLVQAIKNSFSNQLISLFAYMILYYLLSFASLVIFMFVVVMFMQLSKIVGILFGFVGFFFLLFFIVRFSLGFAAIVHGRMTVSEAFSYSFSKLNFKRAAMLLLMGIVLLVVMSICSGIGSLIEQTLLKGIQTNATTTYAVNQILGTMMGVLVSTFLFTGSSALYFRYSEDQVEEEDDLNVHLIND